MQFLRKKGLFESGRVLYLSVDSLRPNPNQPRTQFSQEGLEELSASIQEHGILQPLSAPGRGLRADMNWFPESGASEPPSWQG